MMLGKRSYSICSFFHCHILVMTVLCCFCDHGLIVPGRVRVAVRLRPQNAEEMAADADFADCVELQPEVS